MQKPFSTVLSNTYSIIIQYSIIIELSTCASLKQEPLIEVSMHAFGQGNSDHVKLMIFVVLLCLLQNKICFGTTE